MPSVTLINGRQVDSASPEWRAECLQRQRHIDTLMSLALRHDRAQYLADVEKAEGPEAARRLRERFAEAWAKKHQPQEARKEMT